MTIRNLMSSRVFVPMLLLCTTVSCVSTLDAMNLPIRIKVVNATTKQPITNAIVKLEWRVGLGGYYWGKPVSKPTDASGTVIFASKDVPPISSDGYSLGKEIKKLSISTLVVSAKGCKKKVLAYPKPKEIELVELSPE